MKRGIFTTDYTELHAVNDTFDINEKNIIRRFGL